MNIEDGQRWYNERKNLFIIHQGLRWNVIDFWTVSQIPSSNGKKWFIDIQSPNGKEILNLEGVVSNTQVEISEDTLILKDERIIKIRSNVDYICEMCRNFNEQDSSCNASKKHTTNKNKACGNFNLKIVEEIYEK